MNLLIISAVFPPEPVVSANLSFDIASFFSDKARVTVISPIPSRPLGFEIIHKSPEYSFKHIIAKSFICPESRLLGRIYESYSFGKYCYKYIKKHHRNIDLIYANTWPLLGQYYVVKAAKKFNIPIVVHIQDIYPESLTNKIPFGNIILKPFLLPVDKYVLRNANKVIAISSKMADFLIKTRSIKKEKVTIVYNWQDEEDFLKYNKEAIKTDEKGPFTFMYLGNIGPVAGVDLLVESFHKADLKNSRLVIAGSGSMRDSLIRKVEILQNKNIEFWQVPEGKVAEVQNKADVLLLPVKKGAALSSIPSKLPAYMYSAKPVIACIDQDSDTASAILHAHCGWVLPPESPSELIELMKRLPYMPDTELKLLGKNGLNYALKNFSKRENLFKITECIING